MHVCVYQRATRWDSAAAKRAKRRNRDDAYKKINYRNSEQKLAEMVACNFGRNDYHVLFTLSDAYNTQNYKLLRRYWQNTMAKVRLLRRRRGAEPLTYLYVMEGLHGDKRLHIHALLKAEEMQGDGWADMVAAWQYGTVEEVRIADWEHRDNIGKYLSKEPRKFGRLKVGQRIFNASHNCRKPRRTSYGIADDAEFVVPEGYDVVISDPRHNPYGDFIFYVLRKKGSDISVEEWLEQ